MIPAQLLEGVLSLPDIFGKHLANVEEHWRPHLVRSLVSHQLILMSIWLCGKICWLSLQRVPCGFVPRPKRFVASVPCFSASGKRPAVKQGPDLYLEPKWLRCLQHVICTRPTKVPFSHIPHVCTRCLLHGEERHLCSGNRHTDPLSIVLVLPDDPGKSSLQHLLCLPCLSYIRCTAPKRKERLDILSF